MYKMTNKKVITKENNVRIKDDVLISRLNTAFKKFDIGDTSKNTFLVHLLKLGVATYEKEWKDSGAVKNETTTLLDAIHEHTKRMNFFIKFSKPFIEETYANNEINQLLLLRMYHKMIEKMSPEEKQEFKETAEYYDKLPKEFELSKKKMMDYYRFKVE